MTTLYWLDKWLCDDPIRRFTLVHTKQGLYRASVRYALGKRIKYEAGSLDALMLYVMKCMDAYEGSEPIIKKTMQIVCGGCGWRGDLPITDDADECPACGCFQLLDAEKCPPSGKM